MCSWGLCLKIKLSLLRLHKRYDATNTPPCYSLADKHDNQKHCVSYWMQNCFRVSSHQHIQFSKYNTFLLSDIAGNGIDLFLFTFLQS